MNELEKYYNKFNEDKRLLSRHGQVEFAATTKYIKEIFGDRKNLKIIDIGAGTGRYSAWAVELGQDVTAVEVVNKNLGQIKLKNEKIKTKHCDARKLKFDDNTFDVALLFGPVYHLFSFADKLKAIEEAKRVVKKNGFVLVMYLMNEYAVITHAFKEGKLQEVLKDGKLNENFECVTDEKDLYSYVRIDEIYKLSDAAGLDRVKIVAVDGATDYIRKTINSLSEEDFKIYIDYQMSIAERSELLGASSHVLDILQKK